LPFLDLFLPEGRVPGIRCVPKIGRELGCELGRVHIMQLENLLRQKTRLPYLFYGPARSGKATSITTALKQLGYQVKQLEKHEFPIRLQSNTLLGRTAYIAKISSLQQELDAQPGTLIVYCCIDPYQFGTAEQLRARFTLVDLKSTTYEFDRCVGGHRDVARQAPWTALQWLRHAKSYSEQLVIVERSPELSNILYRNVECCENIDQWAVAMEKFSLYDARFPSYIDHSASHRTVLECATMLPILGNKLNYRSNGQTYYAKKPTRTATEKYKALTEPPPAKKIKTKKPRQKRK